MKVVEPKSLFCGIKTRALYAAVCCMPVEHVCKGEEEKWLWIKLFFLWSQNTDSYVFCMGYTRRAFRKRYCKRHWCNCKLPEGQSYITCRMCQNKETNRRFKTHGRHATTLLVAGTQTKFVQYLHVWLPPATRPYAEHQSVTPRSQLFDPYIP